MRTFQDLKIKVKDIEDALSKKPDMIIFFLSFTSLGMGFPKHTFNKNISLELLNAFTNSISIEQSNRTTQNI